MHEIPGVGDDILSSARNSLACRLSQTLENFCSAGPIPSKTAGQTLRTRSLCQRERSDTLLHFRGMAAACPGNAEGQNKGLATLTRLHLYSKIRLFAGPLFGTSGSAGPIVFCRISEQGNSTLFTWGAAWLYGVGNSEAFYYCVAS